MWKQIAASLRDQAGIVVVDDLGCVYSGRCGKYDCTVSLSIETWHGAFYICLMIDHRSGMTFRRMRGIKWPFSHESADDVTGVLSDLDRVVRAREGLGLSDTRDGFARGVDWLTRRAYLGSLAFRSVVVTAPEVTILADVERSGGQTIVSLWQHTPKRGSILGQIPYEAFSLIAAALRSRSRK